MRTVAAVCSANSSGNVSVPSWYATSKTLAILQAPSYVTSCAMCTVHTLPEYTHGMGVQTLTSTYRRWSQVLSTTTDFSLSVLPPFN